MNQHCKLFNWFSLSRSLHPHNNSSKQLSSDARSLGINTHTVRDAGRTQIAAGSKTVLCVGPGVLLSQANTTHMYMPLL